MLHPPPPDWERQRVRNDDSVVLAVTLGGVRALMTGDISAAVEAEVAAAAAREWASREPALPRFTLLKVAHHGSAGSTSTPFLQATQPVIAVVSAGADDPFGHPAAATLERLGAGGVEVWRTDREGEVTVAVSAGSAALSAAIRDDLAAKLDRRQVKLADAMKTLRPAVRNTIADPETRAAVFRDLASAEAMDIADTRGIEGLFDWIRSRHPSMK